MRAFRFLNVAILSMLVGCSALVVAQDDKPQDDKPARQEEPKAEPKAQPKQDEMKPPRQEDAKPAKTEKQDEKQQQQEQKNREQMKPEQQMHPEQGAKPEQMHPAQAGNPQPGKSARIPDDKFRQHFGHDHKFNARTVIVQGQPQFQYGGYSFQLVDAWPADWAYTDDCYIDYIDGEYFLFDLLHPGLRITIIVVM